MVRESKNEMARAGVRPPETNPETSPRLKRKARKKKLDTMACDDIAYDDRGLLRGS